MKTYWDHTEKERAELTYEQVADLLKFELMEKGAIKPEPPTLLDETSPEIPTTMFYRVMREGRYSSPEHFDALFSTIEDAEAFIRLNPLCSVSEYLVDGEWVKQAKKLCVMPIALPIEQDHVNARAALASVTANKKANQKATAEYNSAVKAVNEACDGIWEDYRECQSREYTHKRLVVVWRQYLQDCDGDDTIAMKFLRKAYSEDQIGSAFAWCGVETPAALSEAELDLVL